MISKLAEEKIKKFFSVVTRLAEKSVRAPVAMMIAKKEIVEDVIAASSISNEITFLRADKNIDDVSVVKELADVMESGRLAVLEIGDYLHPAIYNAIFLLSSASRIEYDTTSKRVVALPKKGAAVILYSREKDLSVLNYDNLLNLVGITERL